MKNTALPVLCLTLSSVATAQPLRTEIPLESLTTGPITTIAPGSSARSMWAAPAAGMSLWQKNPSSTAWTQLGVPGAAQPKTSPFIPYGGVLLSDAGETGLLYSPRGNGIWRSSSDGSAFVFSGGVPSYNGWDFGTDYRFGAVAVVSANNALYAAMGRDEGNSSNGHSASWLMLGSAGVMRSTDGGQTWAQFSTGLPTFQFDNFFGTTREPVNVISAVGNTLLVETLFEKVYRSIENGPWQLVPGRAGLPDYSTNMRPVSLLGWCASGRGVLAFVRGEGVYLSTNNGSQFTSVPARGLPAQADLQGFIDTPRGLFVVLGTLPTEENPAPPRRLMRSTDDGLTFRRHSGPIMSGVTAMAYKDGRLYIGTGAHGLLSVDAVSCAADLGAQGGIAEPDGRLDNNDFVVFIDAFFAGSLETVDIGSTGGAAVSDGVLNNDDFIVFIDRFFAGCG